MTKVSIVVEWETALEQADRRGEACLASLRPQVAELPSCETVVCFDPSQSAEESVRAAIGGDWPGSLVVAATPSSLDYYQKKNHGFTLTTGAVVVFVDSDLITVRHWLRDLVAPLSDFRHSVVVGRTHLETRTLYERAVALFWIFDAPESAPLRPTRRLVSNNIAFRRAVFDRFPFPDRPTYRGQCSELGAILDSCGIVLYEQPSAAASHPAPDGLSRFAIRAWRAGTDETFYRALEGQASLARAVRSWRTDLRRVRERIALRAPVIGVTAVDRLMARILGFAYYSIKLAGAASAVRTRAARRDQRSMSNA